MTYPNGNEITFDRRTKTSSGWDLGIEVMSNADEISKLGNKKDKTFRADGAIAEKEPKMPIKEYHEEIGHPNFALTRATEKA